MVQKKYSGIKFSDGSHSMIPTNWISTECGVKRAPWPPKKDFNLLEEKVAEGSAAPEHWPLYKIEILAQSSKLMIEFSKILFSARTSLSIWKVIFSCHIQKFSN